MRTGERQRTFSLESEILEQKLYPGGAHRAAKRCYRLETRLLAAPPRSLRRDDSVRSFF